VLAGIDGLVAHGRDLIAIQNGVQDKRWVGRGRGAACRLIRRRVLDPENILE
jgi:hypothetical protein